jgi:hypothetical protein
MRAVSSGLAASWFRAPGALSDSARSLTEVNVSLSDARSGTRLAALATVSAEPGRGGLPSKFRCARCSHPRSRARGRWPVKLPTQGTSHLQGVADSAAPGSGSRGTDRGVFPSDWSKAISSTGTRAGGGPQRRGLRETVSCRAALRQRPRVGLPCLALPKNSVWTSRRRTRPDNATQASWSQVGRYLVGWLLHRSTAAETGGR